MPTLGNTAMRIFDRYGELEFRLIDYIEIFKSFFNCMKCS